MTTEQHDTNESLERGIRIADAVAVLIITVLPIALMAFYCLTRQGSPS